MGVFTIYAIVVTGLFLLYMTVTIALDLYGKKDKKKDETEVFNTSDGGSDEEETAHVVNETDGGYSIGSDEEAVEGVDSEAEGDAGEDPDDGEAAQEEQYVDSDPDDEDLLMQESEESQAAYESLKEVQQQMDSAAPVYQHQYSGDDFAFTMAQPMNQGSKILRQIVKI